MFYLALCFLFFPSMQLTNPPPGDTDDSISDEQRVVIDPSLCAQRKCRPRLQGGGLCPAGLLPEVEPEHDRQEVSLTQTHCLVGLLLCALCYLTTQTSWMMHVLKVSISAFLSFLFFPCFPRTRFCLTVEYTEPPVISLSKYCFDGLRDNELFFL